jgi:hypothetical protein
MSLKRTLTAVAVDSARDYLQEKLHELKQLDLDKDGQKDVDQIAALLTELAERVKASVEATDFQKLASGLDQIISGAALIGDSVDKEKLAAAFSELSLSLRQLGTLLKLGVADLKARDNN